MYILGIAAGKGGVGKSTTTAFLAKSFSKMGYKVGIIDADIYGPSIRKLLPEDHPPREEGDRVIPAMSGNISYVSIDFFSPNASVVRAPIANGIIEQFVHAVEWGDLDYLLVDFPPGTGDVQLTLMQLLEISGMLIVTTPQELALLDVRKAIQMALRMNVPLLGIAENMSYFEDSDGKRVAVFGEGGGDLLAREFDLPLLAKIPLSQDLESYFATLAKQIETFDERLEVCEHSIEKGGLDITWGERRYFIEASRLQAVCPCVRCGSKGSSEEAVAILGISPVGKYAIRAQFSSGCSKGIYLFEHLKSVGEPIC